MKESKSKERKFRKQELLQAKLCLGKEDLISALLEDDRDYSLAEMDTMIEKFMKGKVK